MSAFLGPIHYWLFNKIVQVEGRAMAIAETMQSNGKADIANAKIEEYGEKLDGADLAQLVGDNSIHNFLYGLISKVEVFEAGLVEAAGDNLDSIMQAVQEHGRKIGGQAVADKGEKPEDLEGLYQYINDFQLEGMPCDPGAEVGLADGALEYKHSACNHISNWEYTSCASSTMCKVHNAWLKGFISGLNGSATYEVEETIASGASRCMARIKL